MVHEDDRGLADEAMGFVDGRIVVPTDWQGTWRRRTTWRGLGGTHLFSPSIIGTLGKPVVSFTGTFPQDKKIYYAEAEASNWQVALKPHSKTTVLVAADFSKATRKLVLAKKLGIPVLTLIEWHDVRTDGVLPR